MVNRISHVIIDPSLLPLADTKSGEGTRVMLPSIKAKFEQAGLQILMLPAAKNGNDSDNPFDAVMAENDIPAESCVAIISDPALASFATKARVMSVGLSAGAEKDHGGWLGAMMDAEVKGFVGQITDILNVRGTLVRSRQRFAGLTQ